MLDESTYLDSKNEAGGCGFPPGGESFLRRQTIKTVIEFYGSELPGVK
jgi:hypothetical protein